MPGTVARRGLHSLIGQARAQVVEVLPKPEYDWAHIAGAVEHPAEGARRGQCGEPGQGPRPVVVYCNDLQ